MEIEELKQEVIKEAELLKLHARLEELDALNIALLDTDSRYDCIYGQMTGDCFSERAYHLIAHCGRPVSYSLCKIDMRNFNSCNTLRGMGYTAIEVYISMIGSGNDALVEFLRGEREQLTVNNL